MVGVPESSSEPETIWRVSDQLWQQIEPLLVIHKEKRAPGRPRANDREIFNALIYLARTGCQ